MSEIKLDEDKKKKIATEINLRIGSDINDLSSAEDLSGELIRKKNQIKSCVSSSTYSLQFHKYFILFLYSLHY